MADVFGDILPLALAIAISPVPIIAVVLTLMSPKVPGTSLGFLFGTLGAVLVLVVAFVLLSSLIPESDPDTSRPTVGTIKIVLGSGLLFLALRKWQSRPAPGDAAPLPGWMSTIDALSPVRAIGMGFLITIANPKNIILIAAAGVTIGPAYLSPASTTVVISAFALLATISIWPPILAYMVTPHRVANSLEEIRAWLVQNNQALLAAVLVIIGAGVLGQGIGAF